MVFVLANTFLIAWYKLRYIFSRFSFYPIFLKCKLAVFRQTYSHFKCLFHTNCIKLNSSRFSLTSILLYYKKSRVLKFYLIGLPFLCAFVKCVVKYVYFSAMRPVDHFFFLCIFISDSC